MRRLIVGLATTGLLWGAIAGVAAGPAAADAFPGCPEDHPEGPCHWCPGDPVVQTGNLRYDPVRWDANVCHTYWRVGGGGNVARTIFEGDAPPPPPPPVTGLICDPGTFTNCRIETRP
jgi:hypothetical protein